jgi:hypothetical protein
LLDGLTGSLVDGYIDRLKVTLLSLLFDAVLRFPAASSRLGRYRRDDGPAAGDVANGDGVPPLPLH